MAGVSSGFRNWEIEAGNGQAQHWEIGKGDDSDRFSFLVEAILGG